MDIVFNIDNGYVRHLCVTMLSILDHNKDASICFHIMTFDLSVDNRQYVKDLVRQYGASVKFYDVDVDKLKDFPIGAETNNPGLSYATYLRLFIVDMLPETIEKVLFLDCDIVVINSLTPLWNTDISDYCLAAVTDWDLAQKQGAKRMNLEKGYKYFNAGVLLLNVKKLREMKFSQKVAEFVMENKETIKLHDQDILNGMLYKQRLELRDRWNMVRYTDNIIDYTIIHFAGIKPWHIECEHPLKHIYYKYLSYTKWIGSRPIHRDSVYQRIKNRVKKILGL